MARFLFIGGVVLVALDIFAIVDIVMIDQRRVRGLPKVAWAFIVLIPVVGLLLWFLIGRAPEQTQRMTRVLAPDDDPNFLRDIRRDEEAAERIRRLEQELADLDDDPPAAKD